MSTVKIEDRSKEIEQFRMALNMCELYVNYQQTELIGVVLEKYKELKGQFSLEDAFKILKEHRERWEKYFKEKE